MGGGRHERRARWKARTSLRVALGGIVALGGAAFAGWRYDAATAGRILPGVEVGGVDLGGLTRSEATRAVAEAAEEILDREIEVLAAGEAWHVTPEELGTTADVSEKVAEALAVNEEFAWPNRVLRRLFGGGVDRSMELELDYDHAQVERFVDVVAGVVRVSPVDAAVEVREGELVLTRPKRGRLLERFASRSALIQAIGSGEEVAEFAVRTLRPRVTGKGLGQTIVVRLSRNELYLYRGLKVRKTYRVATGSPGFPTPQGHWNVVDKVAGPSWTNPAPDGWGKDLPRYIPPGPGNPLGTRALYLDAPGIRIHGTYASSSIGTYASHGCIRMHISDSEELFEIVEPGTPVLILW